MSCSYFGEGLTITRAEGSDYFKFYINRFENGICTLKSGCANEKEVTDKISELLNKSAEYDDYVKKVVANRPETKREAVLSFYYD